MPNYQAMWNQLKDELVGFKKHGDELIKKYGQEKSGGQKKREAEATQRVIETVQKRMIRIEQDNTEVEVKEEGA